MASQANRTAQRRAQALRALCALLPLVLLGVTPVPSVIRVPEDAPTLSAALAEVSADGDVIELAAGTYPSPLAAADGFPGFRISDLPVDFTIRAAPGAIVVLDGENARPVLRFQNTDPAKGGHVVFEHLVFRNGLSQRLGVPAGVTMQRAQATFRDCTFDSNATVEPLTGSGGIGVSLGSTALFERCTWTGNSSRLFGGGLGIEEHSQATVRDSLFLGNSVALPDHHPTAAGGGIHVGNSTLVVERTRFEGNEAGYVGGGLYAIGSYGDTGSSVTIDNCTFVGNRAVRDPSVSLPDPTEGGGVHAENLTTMRISNSRFIENEANDGGGLNAYRADVEVRNSAFLGNRAAGGEAISVKSVGGQISVISNDGSDATTDYGTVNRPPARLLVEDSLFRGRSGATTVAADVGGCVFAQGDTYRAFGLLGVPPMGTFAENRAPVTLRRVVLDDCDVQQTSIGGSGVGGGIAVDTADLTLEDALVIGSDAFGMAGDEQGSGGGLAVMSHSHVAVRRTVFADDTASRYGGALFSQGADLDVADSAFLRNEVSPGVAEDCTVSYGAALFVSPFTAGGGRPAQPATGVVASSVLSDNAGVPIFDDDRTNGPINDTRYDGNQVYAAASGGQVYSNTVPNHVAPFSWCITAAQMSALVVQRDDGSSTAKAQVANVDLGAEPATAALVPAPAQLLAGQAAGDGPPPPQTALGFVWSGGAASLNGQPIAPGTGIEDAPAGSYALVVDGGAARADALVMPEPGAGGAVLAAVAALAGLRSRRSGRARRRWRAG